MTVSYRPTQDQDPQEPGSQQNKGTGAGPHDDMVQQPAAPGSPPRVAEPNRRRVFANPLATPQSGTRFSGQENNGQNPPVSNQNQPVEQLPTVALPTPPPLTSNRAQTIEQLRAAALSAPPASPYPNMSANNRQQWSEQAHRSALH